MIKSSITLLIAIFMFISPVLHLKDQLHFDHLIETSFKPLIFDHEIQIVKIATFLEMQASKLLVAYRSYENCAIYTMKNDQRLQNLIEFFPHDKSFLIVKKFQSNYLP